MGENLYCKKGALPRRGKVYFLDAAHLLHAAIPSRGWIKRKVACNRYHATFAEFQAAVQKVLNNIAAYRNDFVSLMTERFQLFTTP